MSLTVKRTGAADYGRYTKALIVGEPGAGKTLISSTWVNPIYASAEGGLMSVANRNVPFVEINTSKDLRALKGLLDQSPEVRERELGFPVETVVIDTIDEIQKILIRERLAETRKDAMTMQDWGWLGEQMKAIITGFRNMDMHVVFCCHIKDKDDQETGASWTIPGLQGSTGNEIAGYVDFSLLLKTSTISEINPENNKVEKRTIRILQTYKDARNPWIKDRSGKLPNEFEVNFVDDFDRIYQTVFADVGSLPESTSQEVEQDPKALEDIPAPTVAAKPEPAPERPKAKVTPKSKPEPKPEPAPEPDVEATQPEPETEPVQDALTTEQDKPSAEASKPEVSLPDGITPEDRGYGTGIYCEVCGGEVETEDQADLSRIRFRKVMDRPCFKAAKR